MTDTDKAGMCPRCLLYARARGPVVRAEIDKLTDSPAETEARWTRFLADYHELHLEAVRYLAVLAELDEDAS